MKKIALLTCCLLSACGGPKGDTGATGATGAVGATGTSGITISSGFVCSKVTGGLVFAYRGVVYTSGDVFVECSISDLGLTYSNSAIFKSGQTGATTGACSMVYDSESPNGSGFWTFTMNTTKKVVYTDSGATINGLTVTYATTDCTSY